MRLKAMIVCALLLFTASIARAQQHDPKAEDFAETHMFSPELIMQYQQTLGLTEEQKKAFKHEIRQLQTRLTELQWRLEDGVEKIDAMVKPDQIDEKLVMAQLDDVLKLEHEIKRANMVLLIKLKNRLTPEQQARLRELKAKQQGK
jgi:Spy/CpxP family protein refolding chaperone